MTTIVITRPVDEAAIALLRPRGTIVLGNAEPPLPTADEVAGLIRDADIVYTLPANPLTGAALEGAKNVRMIATMGTGYDNIDVAAARRRGIPVTYAPGILDETTADCAFALLLAAARRFGEAERHLRAGEFRGWSPSAFLGQDVHGATLGIVGMGRIGRAMARRATGFGMRIMYSHPRSEPQVERDLGAQRVELGQLLREADFVSLHVPLRPETRHLIDAAALRTMKSTAVLVNTSRGPIVDERALAEALQAGEIAAAGIDVFEREPSVEPLLMVCENALLLPHIASAVATTRRRMAVRAAENILAFLDGKPLLNPVP